MRLRSIPPKTSTGPGRSSKRPHLGFSIGFGGLGGLSRLGIPVTSFKPKVVPAKAKKKGKVIKIRLLPEEGGLLKMYVEDE